MKIPNLYKSYFQKSKVFLYPALGITTQYHTSNPQAPVQTFLQWDRIKCTDKKLVCLYNTCSSVLDRKLRSHSLFSGYTRTEDFEGSPAGVYIFSFRGSTGVPSDYLPDMKDKIKRADMWGALTEKDKRHQSLLYSMSYNWDCFLRGQYSKLSAPLKKRIKNYYIGQRNSYAYIESFVHPDKYRVIYSELLGVPLSTLEKAVELTDKPDLSKETLNLKPYKIKVI